MKKKTFISSLLALTLASSLLMPSTLTYGQKHIDVKEPTPNALAEKEDLRHKMNERENLSIQDIGIMGESQIVPESITVAADKQVAGLYDTINFTVSLDAGGEVLSFAYLTLRAHVGGRSYEEYVYMEYIDENLFEGEFEITNDENAGLYSVDSIEFFTENSNNEYSIVETIYNSAFWEENDYNSAPLPIDFIEIEGTQGEVVPELYIESSKDTYTENEEMILSIEAIAENIDYNYATVYLENVTYNYKPEISIDLEKGESKLLTGSFEIHKYIAPGEYRIDSIILYDEFYGSEVYIRNIEQQEDYGDRFNYSDFDNFSVDIHGTINDQTEPEIVSVKIEKTDLAFGESLMIEVEAIDKEVDELSITVSLSGDGYGQYGKMWPIGENKYRGAVTFRIEEEIEKEYEVIVHASDSQENYTRYYDEELKIRFSGNHNIRTISGSNRFNTAIEIGRHVDSFSMAIVASGESFPDALAAGPLSTLYSSSIYLAQKNRISQSTLSELKNNDVQYVTILGGESAVSSEVERTLIDAGMSVDRIAGNNRFDTAIQIAEYLYSITGSEDSRVVLANGMNYPDALSIGSYASINGLPILLTKGDALHKGVKEFLDSNGVKNVDIVGGESVISEAIVAELEQMGIQVTRYAGADRYSTSVVVAEKLFDSSDKIVVANGMNFADALAAVPLAAQKNMPIILVRPDRLPKTIETYVKDNKDRLRRIVPVGGEAAVSIKVKEALGNLLQ